MCSEVLCKLSKEYLNALTCKFFFTFSTQNSETFDLLHTFFPLTAANSLFFWPTLYVCIRGSTILRYSYSYYVHELMAAEVQSSKFFHIALVFLRKLWDHRIIQSQHSKTLLYPVVCLFLARDVIYTSRTYATMSVSVCLSVTEVIGTF